MKSFKRTGGTPKKIEPQFNSGRNPLPQNKWQDELMCRGGQFIRTKSTSQEISLPDYVWNAEAQQVINHLYTKRSTHLNLTGRAGTGKTTVVIHTVMRMIAEGLIPPLDCTDSLYNTQRGCETGHPHLKNTQPSVVFLGFSNPLANKLLSMLPPLFKYKYQGVEFEVNRKNMAMTIHKFLNYSLNLDKVADDGEPVFVPYRNENNLNPGKMLIVVDEAGMVDAKLGHELLKANPDATFVFLGDLGQLTSIIGVSSLGVSLATPSIHSVEMREVYRNEGAILRLADDIRFQRTKFIEPDRVCNYIDDDPSVVISTYPTEVVSAEEANTTAWQTAINLTKQDRFQLGVDLLMASQYPNAKSLVVDDFAFGLKYIQRSYDEAMDAIYNRNLFRIQTKAGPIVCGAGDVKILPAPAGGQAEYMFLFFSKNKDFVALNSFPPRKFTTRNPLIWDQWEMAITGDEVKHAQDVAITQLTMDAALDAAIGDIQPLADDAFDTTLLDFANGDFAVSNKEVRMTAEERSEKRSEYTILAINLDTVKSFISTECADGIEELLTRAIVRELTNLAILCDRIHWDDEVPVTLDEVKGQVYAIFERYGMTELIANDNLNELTREIVYTSAITQSLPAFVSAHRAQGREAPTVIVCIHSGDKTTREHFYTMTSRAKRQAYVLSHCRAFGQKPEDYNPKTGKLFTKAPVAVVNRTQVDGHTLAEKREAYREEVKVTAARGNQMSEHVLGLIRGLENSNVQ